jgi:hypothetical protein
MKGRLLAVAVVAALAGPGSARGEPTGPQEILTTGTTEPSTGIPSAALTTAIAEWLVSVGFQPAQQLPKIVAVSQQKLISMRQRGLPGEVVAVYDDSSSTIYLALGWTSATPAGLSVIVHEMVHHLQRGRIETRLPGGTGAGRLHGSGTLVGGIRHQLGDRVRDRPVHVVGEDELPFVTRNF